MRVGDRGRVFCVGLCVYERACTAPAAAAAVWWRKLYGRARGALTTTTTPPSRRRTSRRGRRRRRRAAAGSERPSFTVFIKEIPRLIPEAAREACFLYYLRLSVQSLHHFCLFNATSSSIISRFRFISSRCI